MSRRSFTPVAILHRTWDWMTTIPTLIAFSLTLLVGDVAIRIARLFGRRAMEYTVGVMQRGLLWSFRPSGVRIEVDRHPDVEKRAGYIFLSNHQSLFDVPIFGGLLLSNYPKYVAKEELAKWIPLVSYNLRKGGNAVIDRGDRSQAVEAIRTLGKACQERNVSVVLFPEGSRSRDGTLKTFRTAGAESLLEAAPDLPVVPTTIDGSWRLLINKLFPIPFGTRIRVRFGAPIRRESDERRGDIIESARASIAATLGEWRAALPEPS